MRVRGEEGTGLGRLATAVAKTVESVKSSGGGAAVQPATTSLSGPRTDDPHGNGSNRGVRVRIGLLSDGSYGVERWLEDGTRQTPTWS